MSLTTEQVEHVARLARLNLTADEVERFRGQMSVVLEHADRVMKMARDDVAPTSHAIPLRNVFRADVAGECLTQEQALSTAPESEQGRFRVPRIIEDAQ